MRPRATYVYPSPRFCVDLFVEKLGSLIGATQAGQVQMREIIRHRLTCVVRDPRGVPEKIVLFRSWREKPSSVDVVIDPKFSFGRPILDGLGVRTAILAERFDRHWTSAIYHLPRWPV